MTQEEDEPRYASDDGKTMRIRGNGENTKKNPKNIRAIKDFAGVPWRSHRYGHAGGLRALSAFNMTDSGGDAINLQCRRGARFFFA